MAASPGFSKEVVEIQGGNKGKKNKKEQNI